MRSFGNKKSLNDRELAHKKRRRRELYIILLVIALIIALTATETHLVGSSVVPLSDNVVIFALVNINIILLLLVIFLVLRNVAKLIFERKAGILGSKLRTKLVVSFVIVSLIPTTLLFIASISFISTSVESWFSKKIEQSLRESIFMAQNYYQKTKDNALFYSQILALQTPQFFRLEKDSEGLKKFLMDKLDEYNVSMIELVDTSGKVVVRASKGETSFGPETYTDSAIFKRVLVGQTSIEIEKTALGGELVRAMSPIYDAENFKDIVGAMSVAFLVPEDLVKQMRSISKTMEEFLQVKALKYPIKISYILILTIVTLLVLFAATWFGFYLAKSITGPIQQLAEGTDRISSGDLDFELQPVSDDELGMLVKSFNMMTQDLKASRSRLQEANLDLDRRRKYMEIVLKNVAAGVISLDEEGRISTMNKSAEKMLKVKAEEVIGKKALHLLKGQHRRQAEEIIDELNRHQHQTVKKEISLVISKEPMTIKLSASKLMDEEGNEQGMLFVFDDLTQLQKAQRAAAWREVARRIAHEIKNPLTPIKLSAQRLIRHYGDSFGKNGSVFHECTATIINQVDTLRKLVNEFSNFAKMPSAHLIPSDLNEIVKEAVLPFKDVDSRIIYKIDCDTELPILNLDPDQMKRVLMNLIDNAREAIEGTGEIVVRTRFDKSANTAVLEVSDTGRGIPPEDKAKLFEPYFSRKKSGTGLGLAIVTNIVSDHNGYIKVRDNEPKGTTFIIELPVKL